MSEGIVINGQEWLEYAACADVGVELFFPPDERSPLVAEAKAICAVCVVRAECLAWAMKNKPEGIWGGMTADERRKMHRNQMKAIREAQWSREQREKRNAYQREFRARRKAAS